MPYIWEGGFTVKFRIMLGLILIGITMIINISIPIILKNTIQALNEFESQKTLNSYYGSVFLLLAYGSVYTVGQLIQKTRQIVFYKVIEQAMRRFSLNIFNHLHNLDLRFHLERKIGAITNSVEKFQYVLPEIFWTLALFIVPTIIEVCVAVTILFHLYHWNYAVILLGTLLIFSIFSFVGVDWITVAQTKYDDQMQNVHSQMVDSLLNYETVRYFNNRQHEATFFDHSLEKLEKNAINFRIKSDLIQMIQGAIVGFGLSFLTWRSGQEVLNGTLGIGDFILINSYLLQFIVPMVSFGWLLVQMKQAFAKLRYVMQLLEEKPTVIDMPGAKDLNAQSTAIMFEAVCFQYQSGHLVLKDISFKVPTGEILAVVGTSGAGKSTIARLLFRFYDVISGKILINGQDIRNISQDSLHAAIGVVSQETILFNNSIYENIRYGNLAASKQEIEKAVYLAHLDMFISRLPNGYNTVVGERGLKLSGGEKQRVSIARVLLKNPSILLFDEATSSLDTITEQEIKKNIMEVAKEKTTIIIAHRLSTITHADNIIVLDQGKIVEQGKHNELIRQDTIYAQLWKRQVRHSTISNTEENIVIS